jgi:glycosyltransferase involved in cell wall biosynthesis
VLGEITLAEKVDLLSRAKAVLFPIDWDEPFGLVMTEAMACGTPVLAMGNGSVPEVVDEGVTGFIVADEAAAAIAARRLHMLDRERIRQVFEERFTARRMAEDYISLYRYLIAGRGAL